MVTLLSFLTTARPLIEFLKGYFYMKKSWCLELCSFKFPKFSMDETLECLKWGENLAKLCCQSNSKGEDEK